MANRLCGGKLDSILADYGSRGLSPRQVCNRLYAEHGIEVTHPTAAKWLAAAKPEAVAS
jgi:hypothetical protein